jgi:hypothetical protein
MTHGHMTHDMTTTTWRMADVGVDFYTLHKRKRRASALLPAPRRCLGGSCYAAVWASGFYLSPLLPMPPRRRPSALALCGRGPGRTGDGRAESGRYRSG